jgi:hypothetical protein
MTNELFEEKKNCYNYSLLEIITYYFVEIVLHILYTILFYDIFKYIYFQKIQISSSFNVYTLVKEKKVLHFKRRKHKVFFFSNIYDLQWFDMKCDSFFVFHSKSAMTIVFARSGRISFLEIFSKLLYLFFRSNDESYNLVIFSVKQFHNNFFF